MLYNPPPANTHATAITTLLGVVAYLAYELARNGGLDVRNFEQHLIDLNAPDNPDERPQDAAMRATVIDTIRRAVAEGVELAKPRD